MAVKRGLPANISRSANDRLNVAAFDDIDVSEGGTRAEENDLTRKTARATERFGDVIVATTQTDDPINSRLREHDERIACCASFSFFDTSIRSSRHIVEYNQRRMRECRSRAESPSSALGPYTGAFEIRGDQVTVV